MTESILPFNKSPQFLTLHSTAPEAESSDPFGFLCFTLSGEEYGVDLKLVSQVVKPPPVTWVPRVSPHYLGVVSIRGEVITLVDLRQLVGIEHQLLEAAHTARHLSDRARLRTALVNVA